MNETCFFKSQVLSVNRRVKGQKILPLSFFLFIAVFNIDERERRRERRKRERERVI